MYKIIVYGMGSLGKKIARKLKSLEKHYNYHIVAFVDKQYQIIDSEFEILSPDSLKELEYDFVLITSEIWFKAIFDELIEKYDVKADKIIHLTQLTKEEKYYCNLCNTRVPFMLDTGSESPIFLKRKIIGGGKRENCVCPVCGGNDRERWLQHILLRELHMGDKAATVLHFAPEKQVEKNIRKKQKLLYITADIEEGRADRVEDITNISFGNDSFDIIICNHILEHIKDESKAFSELKRCLKENGKIVFSVPICWDIDTYEDESVITGEDRLREYGQEDHVRLYGKDIEQRLREHGFAVESYQVDEILSQEQVEEMRLIPQDRVWSLTLL